MTSPFDALAPTYAADWSNSANGRDQRMQVWRQIDRLFNPGDRILDLGCGIGDDALHLMSRGMEVVAIDSSPNMVMIAESRGVSARRHAIEGLPEMGQFDGVVSNFGVFNCVFDWEHASRELARITQPGGFLALCVLSRFCVNESLRFALKSDWKKATRRWSGHALWRGIEIYYRNRWQTRRAFSAHFTLHRRTKIGGGDHLLYIFRRKPE